MLYVNVHFKRGQATYILLYEHKVSVFRGIVTAVSIASLAGLSNILPGKFPPYVLSAVKLKLQSVVTEPKIFKIAGRAAAGPTTGPSTAGVAVGRSPVGAQWFHRSGTAGTPPADGAEMGLCGAAVGSIVGSAVQWPGGAVQCSGEAN
jgi:hypothetical protein